MTKLSYAERTEIFDKVERRVRRAVSYLRSSTGGLYALRRHEIPVSTDYWTLLDSCLATALDIVEQLPDTFFEDAPAGDFFGIGYDRHNSSDAPLEAAEKLLAAMQERRAKLAVRRRIERLANTTGRTPEEAAMYEAKARELRASIGDA